MPRLKRGVKTKAGVKLRKSKKQEYRDRIDKARKNIRTRIARRRSTTS